MSNDFDLVSTMLDNCTEIVGILKSGPEDPSPIGFQKIHE